MSIAIKGNLARPQHFVSIIEPQPLFLVCLIK